MTLKTSIIVGVCIILLVSVIGFGVWLISYYDSKTIEDESSVAEIIDGDTFRLVNGDKVRLLCVDTPEKGKAGYDEAVSFLGGRLLYEDLVLEGNKTDRYGRLLRWVYVNGSLINKEIVDEGYGKVFSYDGENCSLVE